MVFEHQFDQNCDNYAEDAASAGAGADYGTACTYGSISSSSSPTSRPRNVGANGLALSSELELPEFESAEPKRPSGARLKRPSMASIQVPAYRHQPAFMLDQRPLGGDWASIAEATMPLKTSALLTGGSGGFRSPSGSSSSGSSSPSAGTSGSSSSCHLFQASLERRSKEISRKLIWVNLISLLINLVLALVAFYFAFVNNSSSTSAFAADCVLDFISSAIVLWRYYGDLDNVYLQAREQIACIYLGALFEISAFGIIVKGASDIASGSAPEEGIAGYDLIYLAVAATIACTVLTVFKCSLYNTIRDKSILLDVINTLISTIFAMSIIMSQLLINVDASFWYMDPILSILLAIFMAAFGLKVISQNFHVLRPSGAHNATTLAPWPAQKAPPTYSTPLTFATNDDNNNNNNHDTNGRKKASNYQSNLQASLHGGRTVAAPANWQKSDHSSIAFL